MRQPPLAKSGERVAFEPNNGARSLSRMTYEQVTPTSEKRQTFPVRIICELALYLAILAK